MEPTSPNFSGLCNPGIPPKIPAGLGDTGRALLHRRQDWDALGSRSLCPKRASVSVLQVPFSFGKVVSFLFWV